MSPEEKKLFSALKISTVVELALITPVGYTNTQLSKALKEGALHTLRVTVHTQQTHQGKLRIHLWLDDFQCPLLAIFFKATPYHYRMFSQGSRLVIQGKLTSYLGKLQIAQPKIIQEVGKITPRYKSPIKLLSLKALFEHYLKPQRLYEEGLTQKEVALLLQIHYPQTLQGIYEEGHFTQEVVGILKEIEAFAHFKRLQHKKVRFRALAPLLGDVAPFLAHLPFSLTKEQQEVLEEIREDLKQTHCATKRMVVGDVGSGKTMLILASAMIALPHKSLVMAPTSLLALQIYEEAMKYLPSFVKIALVTQRQNKGGYQEADVIIGTHALLHKDDLPLAPLLMIDEQHRFGTAQRAKLESFMVKEGARPHQIQFSATPIPRTQAMMDSALLDVSILASTPFQREVTTHLISKRDFPSLLASIEEELSRGHQALIVYPLVEKSEGVAYQSLEESRSFWEKRFDGVFVTHGKDREKEEVLMQFRQEGKILLATTVIEVGISLPLLTLIVIVGAERLGLATLHQLRGRVGRNGLKSWCYLYSHHALSKRLEKFAQTTNGFDIAKLDLQFRRAGDILEGHIQSGQKFRWLDMAEDEAIVARIKERCLQDASQKRERHTAY